MQFVNTNKTHNCQVSRLANTSRSLILQEQIKTMLMVNNSMMEFSCSVFVWGHVI